MRDEDERYFERIESRLDEAFDLAEAAKDRGRDPKTEVEIPVAVDMADRVENILGIEGVAERVRELEGEMSREEAALELVTDFVEGTVGDYDSREGKVEGAVRTAVALLTEGVVAAPIEGIDRVELLENDDGTEFVNVYYAGPIRSAGGTAQALSVLVADYARSLLGIEEFEARNDEIERYAEEVALYDKETGLQYTPKDTETKFIAKHMPIMLDGEATGDEEVSGFRDLERVDTNNARGGMCLVMAEGIALKAPKIQRYTKNLDEVDWPWLQDLIDGTYYDDGGDEAADEGSDADGDGDDAEAEDGGDADGDGDEPGADESTEPAGPPRVEPATKFLRDLIAGRPVFGHPSEAGGFRLRYGRARNHGFATAGVHPATMHLVDDFLATGTQIKTERPGKAAGVVPVDSIEGPTVKLANGDVRRIDDPEEALEVRNGVDAILDLGEYLVNYGEFVENNHPLAPASYTVEWWEQDLDHAGADVQALRDAPTVDLENPSAAEALEWVSEYDAPLHPAYTYCWHDVPVERFEALAETVAAGELEDDRTATGTDGVLVLDNTEETRRALEVLLVEHRQTEETLRVPDWRPFVRTLGVVEADAGGDGGASDAVADGGAVEFADDADDEEAAGIDPVADEPTGATEGADLAVDGPLRKTWSADDLPAEAREWDGGDNAMKAVEAVAPFAVRERAPTRIGARMGRPEKSESRDLSPAVHTLFPIAEAGGSQRDVAEAARNRGEKGRGIVDVLIGERKCGDCGTETYKNACPDCGAHTEPHYVCEECDRVAEPDESGRVECPRCEREVESPDWHTVDLGAELRGALDAVSEREAAFQILKGVKGLTSATKTPEPIEKGVLRAKHGVTSFKDGTVRYDMTDLPVTSVRPEELDVTAEHFRGLGYETDIDGEPLRHDDQLVELKVQDIVLSDGAAEHMLKTANFVDDLLERFYDLPAFYDVEERDELVGELVFGMAPHTSAAVVGRVVGFTSAAVGYAHPYFHAAKRRNCFHPDTRVRVRETDGTDGGDDTDWREQSVASLVESRLDDPREDDFGTLVQELDADDGLAVPAIGPDGTEAVRPVDAVSKHPAPDFLVEVETATGRSLTVTPRHTMVKWDRTEGEVGDGSADDDDAAPIRRCDARELGIGDRIPLPTEAPGGGSAVAGTALPDGGAMEVSHSEATTSVSTPTGRLDLDEVVGVDFVPAPDDLDAVYCLTVAEDHTLVADGLYSGQCDGDEDCVMLLMDGLLNFSKEFLPDKRGGQMDAPLVMSSRIDPSEIDDEAHNMDIVRQYPREFYEATREMADPDDVEDCMRIAEETLGTDREYTDFVHSHDTTDIHLGPALSAYKTLGSMMDKMDAQLALARKLYAVDETDVAERVIEYHFLPDLIGNLRAFSRQETRCLDCGEKYRRMPLTGDCRECGGRVNLTVHQGSVNKYMDTAIEVAEEFDCRPYTKQRLEVLDRSLESVFENDKNKQSGIADFM
ncbi:DNA-directed DNA polymerase II large subunit [Halobium salinum]|uniref:DNA polymerase II large subunit n=1 Tax=Halobium salinum TaxID=1364940 RepID=A0ABD5PGI3_9EURY|nr:DNA-directed DNA polymerase II large subunit [Halobium salinum]